MSRDTERWDAPLLVWNGLVARVPALVVRAASPEDVEAALAFARDHGLRVRIAGSGEEHARAASERTVTLDVSRVLGPGHPRPPARGSGS